MWVGGRVRYNADNRTAKAVKDRGCTPMVRDRLFYVTTSSGGPGGF